MVTSNYTWCCIKMQAYAIVLMWKYYESDIVPNGLGSVLNPWWINPNLLDTQGNTNKSYTLSKAVYSLALSKKRNIVMKPRFVVKLYSIHYPRQCLTWRHKALAMLGYGSRQAYSKPLTCSQCDVYAQMSEVCS